MITVAITGWNGYIAQNLERALRKAEYSVVGVPRPILYNMPALIDFFDINKPSFIIHTAAYGNNFKQDNDLETIYANIVATVNLLEMTRDVPYKGFINFSSSSAGLEYQTFYSASKASGEYLVKAFVNKYKKPVVNVRPFTVIGKGEQDHHLIPQLIKSCIEQVKIPFVSEPTHDYIGVNDLCEAILKIMEHTEELKGQTIDIGTGIVTTNEEILNIVRRVTNKKPVVDRVKSLRPYDNSNWRADKSILYSLGWRPKQTIEEIIREMVG
jgi:Nucleoside-diphosphate-sugar epimerases